MANKKAKNDGYNVHFKIFKRGSLAIITKKTITENIKKRLRSDLEITMENKISKRKIILEKIVAL